MCMGLYSYNRKSRRVVNDDNMTAWIVIEMEPSRNDV